MIHTILIDSLRAFVGLVGVAALYCGCFLYPDEEDKLQNRIEQFWIGIDKRRRMSQSLALASTVASLINRFLDRILGKRLFSIRMVAITSCLSLLGLEFWEFFMMCSVAPQVVFNGAHLDVSVLMILKLFYPYIFIFILLLAAALVASIYPNGWTTLAALAATGYAQYSWDVVPMMLYGHEISPSLLFILSLASDVLCLVAVRWTLRWLIRKPNLMSFGTGVVIQLVLITALVIAPWMMGHKGSSGNITYESDGRVSIGFIISREYELFGLNTSTGIFALSFLSVLLFMMLNKLMWPALGRAIHPLARFQLIRNRKFMIGIGIFCLAAISPPAAQVVKKIASLF